MLHGHLGGVLDLLGGSAKELGGGDGGHDAGASDFALASYFGAGNGGVGLDDIGEKAGCGHGAEDVGFGELLAALEVIEDGGKDAGGAAGGCGDDDAARGVALGGGEGVGGDEGSALERGFVAGCTDEILSGFAAEMEASGKDAFATDAFFDGAFHGVPHVGEVVPDVVAFALLNVFPESEAFVFDVVEDLGEGMVLVDVIFLELGLLVGEEAAADAVDGPLVEDLALGVEGFEEHSVGVEGKYDLGLPDDFDGNGGGADLDGFVGAVALAGGGEGAVEGDAEARGVGVFLAELNGGEIGAHGVAAGGAVAFLVYFLD